jgi:hypothetical protein
VPYSTCFAFKKRVASSGVGGAILADSFQLAAWRVREWLIGTLA